jgi:CP family cyanate transporter-like MFS transporter
VIRGQAGAIGGREGAAVGQAGLLVSLFLGGLAMRLQLVSIGPLVPRLSADLAIPAAVTGLLVTLPVMCMAVVAVPASIVADRLGPVRGVTICLALMAAVGALRALAPVPGWIIALTIPIGLAIGLGGSLLPIVAKERLPSVPAASTAAYVTGFVLGSTVASAGAVPLAEAAGSWRGPLLLFALLGGVLFVLWVGSFRGRAPSPRRPVRLPRPPWKRPIAWLIVLLFGLQSLIFFALVAWMPAFYVEHGWPDRDAGLALSALISVGLPASLLIGAIGDRIGSRRGLLVAASLFTLAGVAGMNVLPDPGFLWAATVGLGLGMLFPLSLTLPLDVAGDPARAAGYVGLTLGAGYFLSSIAPFMLGALRDVTGSFAASLPLVAALAAVLVILSVLTSPERLARERAASRAA